MWFAITLFSLAILTQTQNCPLVSPNCQANSCAYTAAGALNCSDCNSNAFGNPLIVNGVDYMENGQYVYTCELCSTATPNCVSCVQDPDVAAGIVCNNCNSGYAVVYEHSNNVFMGSTCVACQSGCLSCQTNTGPVSACGANVPIQNCGTNGIICETCAENYANVNGNCYSCLTPTVTMENFSNGNNRNNGLFIGLLVWAIAATIVAIIFTVREIRRRMSKGEQQRLLNG